MDVVAYGAKIEDLIDNALNDLTPTDFKWLLTYIRNMVNEYNDE